MSGELRRRFLAPEVVQTSAMDCGPAALASLAEGLGRRASYGRLREACRTDVDGSSVDALEDAAARLGVDASQVLLPADHLALAAAGALPAIAVVRLDGALLHFVVVWRRCGPWLQIMDPAAGRRWVRRARFERDLYVHELPVPAEAWLEFARSEGFQRPLRRRLWELGLGERAARALVDEARSLADEGRALAALDASVRVTRRLVAGGAIRRGREAARAAAELAKAAVEREAALPRGAYTALAAEPDPETGAARVLLRGAVALSARGLLAPSEERTEHSAALRAARSEPKPRPWRALARLASEGASLAFPLLLAGAALSGAALVVEGVLARALLTASDELTLVSQRLGALALFAGFVLALLAIELGTAAGLARLGRRLELSLRARLAERVPRLADEYFQSRPVSDLAERAHSLHRLRAFPQLAAAGARALCGLVGTAAAIAWIAPRSAPIAAAAALLSALVPFAFGPRLAETDLRARTQAGALARFYLDALLGLTALRAHAAERPVRREHEGLCVEWLRSMLAHLRASIGLEACALLVGFGAAALLLFGHAGAGGDPTLGLLLAFWALALPVFGQELALVARRAAAARSLVLRVLEPLGAPEEERASAPPATPTTEGVAIELEDVSVVVAGRELLSGISLALAPGEEVAVVGPSGAGKSSLVGLLLGWRRPSSGTLRVDGAPLDAAALERLRAATVWVDPDVRLWNASLAQNLAFGIDPSEPVDLGGLVAEAELARVLDRLPDGLRTPLGEGGGLLSGGEGQRVRFGRGCARPRPRLVVLDEAFRGLDRAQRAALLATARRRFRGATLLFVTHDVAATREFPRVLAIDGGRVVEDGAPEELLARTGSLYRALLEADEAWRRELFRNDAWRRWTLRDGRVEEGARA